MNSRFQYQTSTPRTAYIPIVPPGACADPCVFTSGAHITSQPSHLSYPSLSVPSLNPLHSRHVHLSFQVRRPHLSLIVALSGRVHPCLLLTHSTRISKDAPLHTSLPLSTLHLRTPTRLYFHTSSALYRLCTNIYTAHAVVSRPFRLSLHALAISPLALISRALCLLNKTLPPSLPSCLRAFRPSTLVVTSTRNPAGARASTCALQASHPSSDSFISVLTPSHTPSGHRLSGRVTSDLRHQTHACANFRVESCAPFGTHYIPALSW